MVGRSDAKRLLDSYVLNPTRPLKDMVLPRSIKDLPGFMMRLPAEALKTPFYVVGQFPRMLLREDWRSWSVLQPALGLALACTLGYFVATAIQVATGTQYLIPLFVVFSVLGSMEPTSHEKFYIKVALNIVGTFAGSMLGFGFASLGQLVISNFWGVQAFTIFMVVLVVFVNTILQGLFAEIAYALTTCTSAFMAVFFAPSIEVAIGRFASYMFALLLIILTLYLFHYRSADEVALSSMRTAVSNVFELASMVSTLGFVDVDVFETCTNLVGKSLLAGDEALVVRKQFLGYYGSYLRYFRLTDAETNLQYEKQLAAVAKTLKPLFYDVYVMHYNLADLQAAERRSHDESRTVQCLLEIPEFAAGSKLISESLVGIRETIDHLFGTVVTESAALTKLMRRIKIDRRRRASRVVHLFEFDNMTHGSVAQGFVTGLSKIRNIMCDATVKLLPHGEEDLVLVYSYAMYMCNFGVALCAFLLALSQAFFSQAVDRERIETTIDQAREEIVRLRYLCYTRDSMRYEAPPSAERAVDDSALIVPSVRTRLRSVEAVSISHGSVHSIRTRRCPSASEAV